MRKIMLLSFIAIFCCVGNIHAQKRDLSLYENIKSFYKLIGFDINECNKKELELVINVKDLVENLNNQEIAIYRFNSPENDLPSNIIIVEKDSVDIYDIFAINAIISRIVDVSTKYPDISTNKKDIAWIKNILALHLSAIQNVRAEAWIVEKKAGKYKYHIKYNTFVSKKK
jgi:hypothetical protein